MSKGRKRSKAKAAAKAAGCLIPTPGPRPPNPGGLFCGVAGLPLPTPPRPLFGPVIPGVHFPPRPDFVPPLMGDRPFINPEFIMRDRYRAQFPPETHPRVPHPDYPDASRGFLPGLFEGRPVFNCRPFGFVPPEFRAGQPGFLGPDFRNGPPGFREGPLGFVPPEIRDGPRQIVPLLAGIRPSQLHDGTCYRNNPCPVAQCPPQTTNQAVQSGGPSSNENSKNSTTVKTETSTSKKERSTVQRMLGAARPPPGRSLGIITFVANAYGFIERDDLKKYSFSFDAFFGIRTHLVPGVKVHFTAVKESGKECATDVKVAPGGTEEIEDTIHEGVVTTVLPDTYVLEPHPGRIRTILTTETVKLPFGKMDSKATLLLFDRVKFQLLTDIITKVQRATNITPQMPETFQLTKEIREKGVIMNAKDETFTILSKKHENLTASLKENLSEDKLKVMDEVEFTLVTVKDKVKAIRLKKLPEGSVEFASQSKMVTDPPASKSMWKPVTSTEEADEEISSEKYEGTVTKIIPKCSKKEVPKQVPQGMVSTTVDGTQRVLPFISADVITQATILVGDKVKFNIATKQKTKEEHAINIEIQPESFQLESPEQRKRGIVTQLNANSGFIKTPQNAQIFFALSEVMHGIKLSLSEKVEFTLAKGAEGAAEGDRAIRIIKLTESVFTSVPKIEQKKEKKKMTIKFLKDPKDNIKDQIKKEGTGLLAAEKPSREKVETSKQDNKSKQENPIKGNGEHSRSSESSRRRSSRSHSRDRSGSYHGKPRSSSRDRGHRSYRRSRSRSRDHSRRYRHSHSRSRSRSRERSGRSDRKRSHSPHYTSEHCRGHRNNNDCSSKGRSRSPNEHVTKELSKKRKELLELNELIACRKAAIAMEQNTSTANQFKHTNEMGMQHGFATFDYQHKTCQENLWAPDMKPVRSVLKNQCESLISPQYQEIERSESPEEETYPSRVYTSAGVAPVWIKRSSPPKIEDQELARKKRQLEDLSECIARKRAIIAMELKAKAFYDVSEKKKNYDFDSCPENLDITTNKNTWQLDIKPDLQPRKSILKKRPESQTDQAQKDLTSSNQYAITSKQPIDGPSDTAFKTACNPPSGHSIDLFKKLINKASTGSQASKNMAINPQSRETKGQNYPTSPSQISQFPDQVSTNVGSSSQSSASTGKSNLATQMERFLGALNKADSNLLSSLLRDARKDPGGLQSQRNPQRRETEVSGGGELYDPFNETDSNEDNYALLGSKQNMIPMLRQNENTQDELLPHERAVVDGSGFSKIVGMKYGIEPKPENRFLYGEAMSSIGQSRLLEENENFVKESDTFKRSEDAREDEDKKSSHYNTIQALLQTIGFNLDRAEVSKLDDRTKERLYGKKVKSQHSRSFDQKLEQSDMKYDQRDRSHSTDSEGVGSVSPAKTSNREVYMSYLDSIKNRHCEETVDERDLFSLKRTITNSPKAKQMTSDPYKSSQPDVPHDSYKTSEFSSTTQHQGYSYAISGEHPYASFSLNTLHYAAGYPPPPSYLPSGYEDYTASAGPLPMMPPSPAQFYPTLSTFATPGSFGPSQTSPNPLLGQIGIAMNPGTSGYTKQQTKPTKLNRCLKTIETVSVSLSGATDVSAPVMEDDIKAKQKKRLEQFNQRMRQKKEQQLEAQRTRGQSEKSAPGKVMQTEVKNVWICGHSLVFWAEKRATSPEIGMQLGMDPNSVRIWWKGVQGMTWQQLLPQLLQLKDNWPKPDIILIHLGGNDLGKMAPDTFLAGVKKDLNSLKSIFPQCCLVWSDILPRKSWRHSDDSKSVNNMRQAINKTIHCILAELGGFSLTHDNILPTVDPGLYRPDGVHLSGKGIDTFNLNMQDFLEKWERELSERDV